jgi:TonB-dependent SusC/RagA subfamily outer membrane receptor
MEKKSYLFLLIWLAICGLAQAQNQRVTGKVSAKSDKQGLPGANVIIKGTTMGTSTDVDGQYSLEVSLGAVLQFSMIGMTPQEVPVGNQSVVNIELADDAQALEEVVVVGYGTQRRRDLTGAVAQVKGEEIVKYPVQTPTQALQSKLAGVQVISSGQPNEQPQIRVRGVGSALAGVSPLYVVDGVLTDDIRNISNNDILSIEVLKDASAAIYGVRAANGSLSLRQNAVRKAPCRCNTTPTLVCVNPPTWSIWPAASSTSITSPMLPQLKT